MVMFLKRKLHQWLGHIDILIPKLEADLVVIFILTFINITSELKSSIKNLKKYQTIKMPPMWTKSLASS